jgi:hypothetical protein
MHKPVSEDIFNGGDGKAQLPTVVEDYSWYMLCINNGDRIRNKSVIQGAWKWIKCLFFQLLDQNFLLMSFCHPVVVKQTTDCIIQV